MKTKRAIATALLGVLVLLAVAGTAYLVGVQNEATRLIALLDEAIEAYERGGKSPAEARPDLPTASSMEAQELIALHDAGIDALMKGDSEQWDRIQPQLPEAFTGKPFFMSDKDQASIRDRLARLKSLNLKWRGRSQ